MGLFQNKKRLLEWQKVLLKDSPTKLIMNEKQLLESSKMEIQNLLRISNDCSRIIQETVDPTVFFSRLELLEKNSFRLTQFEPYIKFSGASPTDAYNQIISEKNIAIKEFIQRYFDFVCSKSHLLKTEKGKLNQFDKFYEELQSHHSIDGENVKLYNDLYNSKNDYL